MGALDSNSEPNFAKKLFSQVKGAVFSNLIEE